MEQQYYKYKISPENIVGDLITVPWTGETDISYLIDPCCPITAQTINTLTGTTGYYLPMNIVLSGGTNGTSLLTDLSLCILLTQTTIDIGYYSVFDGAAFQKETLNNFIATASTINPFTYTFYNTSEVDIIKYLSLINYTVDWGDGTTQPVTGTGPLNHTYPFTPTSQNYTITLKANAPWGISIVSKPIVIPYTGVNIPDPQGEAFFIPAGGSWSATPISYDYIFTGDSNTNIQDFYSYNYTTVPFVVSGYTLSTIDDLSVIGPKYNLFAGKYNLGVQVTGSTGVVGTVFGPDPTNTYTAYTIDNVVYYDYEDFTIYIVNSYGLEAPNLVLSALTKNEALLNVIDQPEVQTDIYVERGKYSPMEYIERLGEVDNVRDLETYGYKFFIVEKDPT